eukprot:m.210003 g.210003  ORF g.210003 m.210003 type:complete len:653 (-) comp22102_c1_seq25:703-2661(-)
MSPHVRVFETSGATLDATTVLNDFVVPDDAALPWGKADPVSFALSDSGHWGRRDWGTGDIGTQGSLIARKLLAFGGAAGLNTVLEWLVATPQQPGGKVWGTELGEFHMETQGAWETNAEYVLMARDYVAYARTVPVLRDNAERIVCGGRRAEGREQRVLAGAAVHGPALQDACVRTAAEVAAVPGVIRVRPVLPVTHVDHGTLLLQNVTLVTVTDTLWLPLLPSNDVAWYHTIQVQVAATGAVVGSLNLTTPAQRDAAGWVEVPLAAAQPAGTALVITVRLQTVGPPGQRTSSACWLAFAWLTDAAPAHAGGLAAFTTVNATGSVYPHLQPLTLGPRVAAAFAWQLERARNGTGIFVIPDASFRGTGSPDVNSASRSICVFWKLSSRTMPCRPAGWCPGCSMIWPALVRILRVSLCAPTAACSLGLAVRPLPRASARATTRRLSSPANTPTTLDLCLTQRCGPDWLPRCILRLRPLHSNIGPGSVMLCATLLECFAPNLAARLSMEIPRQRRICAGGGPANWRLAEVWRWVWELGQCGGKRRSDYEHIWSGPGCRRVQRHVQGLSGACGRSGQHCPAASDTQCECRPGRQPHPPPHPAGTGAAALCQRAPGQLAAAFRLVGGAVVLLLQISVSRPARGRLLPRGICARAAGP